MDEAVKQALADLGVTHVGTVTVSDIVFSASFRDACASNVCGRYGTSWSCPPGVGPLDELIARVRRFRLGLVVQTVWPISDSFDYDGMMAANRKHNTLFHRAVGAVKPLLSPDGRILPLGAGACALCEPCAYPEGKPCRHPDHMFASLEAYGIHVTELIDRAGLAYTNGPNTVSYVGLILY